MGKLRKKEPVKGINAFDVASLAITCAMVPLLSHVLTLIWGDNPIWSSERLFVFYFASFSGRVLSEGLQLMVEKHGLKSKGYTFMDSDASGNAVWAFPMIIALFCWDDAIAMIVLLAIFFVSVLVLCRHTDEVRLNLGNMTFVGIVAVLCLVMASVFFDSALTGERCQLFFIASVACLALILVWNFLYDFIRIKRREHHG